MSSFGLNVTVPFLVSFATSLAVNVISFFVGARIAKERADRGTLRELYKTTFAHFYAMNEAIAKGAPKTWDDYTRGGQAGPLIHRYRKDGTLSQFPPHISMKCQDLERNIINAGGAFHDNIRKNLSSKVKIWANQSMKVSADVSKNVSCVVIPLGRIFLDDGPLREVIGDRLRSGFGVSLDVSTEKTGTTTIQIIPERLSHGDVVRALNEIKELALQDANSKLLIDDLNIRKAELKDLLAMISIRINDPHPIRETIFGAVRDLFRL